MSGEHGSSRPRERRPPCPMCGSTDVLPIAYGYPGAAMCEEAERGKIVLGGCCVWDGQPEWSCRACGCSFGPDGPCVERPC